ncbi:MAG: hypothetical protein ACYSU0_17155 [Planctomycetota bacterium]|jgi:hypothetical protein
MTDDPIVAEVRRHRDEIAKECGNDLRRIFEYFRDRQEEGGRKVVDRSGQRERVGREPGA